MHLKQNAVSDPLCVRLFYRCQIGNEFPSFWFSPDWVGLFSSTHRDGCTKGRSRTKLTFAPYHVWSAPSYHSHIACSVMFASLAGTAVLICSLTPKLSVNRRILGAYIWMYMNYIRQFYSISAQSGMVAHQSAIPRLNDNRIPFAFSLFPRLPPRFVSLSIVASSVCACLNACRPPLLFSLKL